MKNLINSILEDGKIESEEVQKLREAIFADGEVDKKEAEALFQLNDSATEKDPSFKDLFVEGIKSYILADGEIDEEEEKFLLEHISKDGQVDENEKALLETLAAETELPESLASLID
jgi:uncharacterized membrane protein YebE (DUF533 family)